ncbi:MAG TPA: HNH endonuclease, partial [Micromonosporaceae bacterium]|nr:HNH endonuclease [Micromonosporaceae bacterium]
GGARRRALAADPQHARKRRERGRAERRVILEAADDGTASLSAFGLAPSRAAAAYERVTAIAKAKKLAGAAQTMDQLRADALLDLLEGVDIGASPTARRGVVELTVGLETLAGLNSDSGTLAGYGPVAADVARQCAKGGLDYRWRFSVRDDQTGELLFQGLSRARPPEAPAPSQQPQPADEQRPPTQPLLAQPPRPRPDRAEPRQPAGPIPHGPAAAASDGAGQGLPPTQDPQARFPNAATARWITSRDRTCRAPGCRRWARSCDIDHTVDFGHGGPTTHDNLGALCRRHHVMKHEAGWQLTQPRPGQFVWVSPQRRVYVVRPEPP